MENERPKVGVGVMIFKDGKVLLGKRKGSHGAGEYAFPGGHLEYGELIFECAIREVQEECGIEIKNLRFNILANEFHPEKHVVHIGIICEWASGEPKLLEPEKSEEWHWYDLDSLPEPVFPMVKAGIEGYKTDKKFFDSR